MDWNKTETSDRNTNNINIDHSILTNNTNKSSHVESVFNSLVNSNNFDDQNLNINQLINFSTTTENNNIVLNNTNNNNSNNNNNNNNKTLIKENGSSEMMNSNVLAETNIISTNNPDAMRNNENRCLNDTALINSSNEKKAIGKFIDENSVLSKSSSSSTSLSNHQTLLTNESVLVDTSNIKNSDTIENLFLVTSTALNTNNQHDDDDDDDEKLMKALAPMPQFNDANLMQITSDNELVSAPKQPTSNQINNNNTNDKKLQLNRFIYKCKYCNNHNTKFKAHIIEHMLLEHKINLMQCPDVTCGKKFKDEWKLKRHLKSNREHPILPQFSNLNDCMRPHVEVKPQKIGFPCPMCVIDTQTQQITSLQQPLINYDNNNNNNKNSQNTDNLLYLDTYEELRIHFVQLHPNYNADSYTICKHCGQVFINRYKLSCHVFNVHSGKRKPRTKKKDSLANKDKLLFNNKTPLNNKIDLNLANIINSVASGPLINHNIHLLPATSDLSSSTSDTSCALPPFVLINSNNLQLVDSAKLQLIKNHKLIKPTKKQLKQLLPERKYLCTLCKRKFKRTRDLQIHVQIMHKNINDIQKQEIQSEIQKTNSLMKSNNFYLLSTTNIANSSINISNNINKDNQNQNKVKENEESLNLIQTSQLNSNNDSTSSNTKICFICNKIFKSNQPITDISSPIINKSYIRHMQIQHGLNEKGERLIECPVCEKSFFNKQQMERHMHTHEIWIDAAKLTQQALSMFLNESINKKSRRSGVNNKQLLDMPDFKDKHSILYCHECVQCHLYFKSLKVLAKHKYEHHNLIPVYKCANTIECNKEFGNVSLFLEHAKIHPQKNITCLRCELKFNNKNALRHHMKNVHYNRKIKASTVTNKRVSNHQANPNNNNNNNNNNKSLNNISFSGSSSSSLTSNSSVNSFINKKLATATNSLLNNNSSNISINNNNSQKIDIICPTCNMEFTSRNSLHNHLATHNTSDLRLFMCDLCGHSFKTRKDLSRHASLHDFSKHKTCQECGMTFKTSFHLKRHMLTRHSNLRPFTCVHCDMTFARKDKLKQHEAKHINHPLYQCKQCNKGFYRKEHLKDHEISKHSKQYPYSCEHCNKGFVHAKDLHRHIRVRHLGQSEIEVVSEEVVVTTNNESPKVNKKQTNKTKCVNKKKLTLKNKQINKLKSSNNFTQQVAQQQSQTNLQLPQQSLMQQATTIGKPPASISANDFKCKKISSILKSSLYLTSQKLNQQQQQQTPSQNQQLTFQQPQQQIIQFSQLQSNNTNNYSYSNKQFSSIQQQNQDNQLIQYQQNLSTFNANNSNKYHSLMLHQSFDVHNHSVINNQNIQFQPTLTQTQQQIQQQSQHQPQSHQQIITIPFNYNNLNANQSLNLSSSLNQHTNAPLQQQSELNTLLTKANTINYLNSNLQQHLTGNCVGSQTANAQTPTITSSNLKVTTKKKTNSKKPKLDTFVTNTNCNLQVANNIDTTIDSILNNLDKQEISESKLIKKKQSVTHQLNVVKSFKCQTCQKEFFYENHLKKHIQSKHSEAPTFSCSHCGKGFATKSTAKMHVEKSHSHYKCPVCSKEFQAKSHAQRHIQNIHHQESNIEPIKENKIDAKIIDLSFNNVTEKAIQNIDLKDYLLTNKDININLNDINLNFNEVNAFNNIWSSLSSSNQQQQQSNSLNLIVTTVNNSLNSQINVNPNENSLIILDQQNLNKQNDLISSLSNITNNNNNNNNNNVTNNQNHFFNIA